VFNGLKLTTVADIYGKWNVSFPRMVAGGPYQLTIAASKNKIVLSDILIGDVWLCSGQSNMAFPLSSAATGKNELARLVPNRKFRLLKFQVAAETNDQVWDSATLQRINELQYFSGQWGTHDAKHAAGFSAVAYYFGKNLVERTGVPIGLIQVAVGGSGIESWIDRATMEQDNQLVDMLANWRKSDFLQDWVRGRADKNLKAASNPRQRHPFEPIYNYEAGISGLTGSPIKGVIWYQGESNTHNVELYERELPLLVSSWRKNWGFDFPFYYVQLSSIDRPSWPSFRDAERKLVNRIPNSGMAVSSDLGDSLNVHPVQKEEVGNRLALLALKHTYQKPVTAEGPAIERAEVRENEIILHFSKARQLSTKDQLVLTGFELVNLKGEHQMAKAIIKNNEVRIPIRTGAQIKAIAYAWRPYTLANLVNEAGLPASTFYYPLKKD
jgi:sialate O-acetylesterase